MRLIALCLALAPATAVAASEVPHEIAAATLKTRAAAHIEAEADRPSHPAASCNAGYETLAAAAQNGNLTAGMSGGPRQTALASLVMTLEYTPKRANAQRDRSYFRSARCGG